MKTRSEIEIEVEVAVTVEAGPGRDTQVRSGLGQEAEAGGRMEHRWSCAVVVVVVMAGDGWRCGGNLESSGVGWCCSARRLKAGAGADAELEFVGEGWSTSPFRQS